VETIKKCEKCGSERIFEFQINNVIQNYFEKLIDFDWGIICVYTCEKNCDIDG
jgi:hypothetical protein